MFESSPQQLVESAPPRVTLRNASAHPFDSAIAAARTCYSSRLITPDEITDKQRLNIGAATFYSGHHTVFQHAHFEFGLENVSRQFVWSFLHAHPFYNSEQQSQRYVRMDKVQAFVPSPSLFFDAASRAIYEQAIVRAWDAYRELSALLVGDTREILNDIWHIGPMSHAKRIQKIERSAEKRAIEIARYVLPIAAFTAMVHTVSGIVLHRLWRMCSASDTPTEAREVVGAMVALVREIDPQFFERFGTEPLEELPEWKHANSQISRGDAVAKEFDGQLAGRTSKLVDYSPRAVRVTADAYRAVAGLTAADCSDAEAIDRLLNPARNTYRLETLNVHLRKKNQPHRRLPGSAPQNGPRLPPSAHPRRHAQA
jgi:flavin-dependent thymidylate synthase